MKALDSKEILKNLIKFKTVHNKESSEEFLNCWDYIDEQMLQIPNWSFREYISNGFVSRVYSHKKWIQSNKKNFKVFLYGNIDVVDANASLFSLTESNGNFYGRGVCDMKFGVAVSISTLSRLSKDLLEKPIAFVITSDEELGGRDGVQYLVDYQGYSGDCIIGPNGKLDSNLWNFELKNKGTIHTKYSTEGISAHGSRPWEGENAIEKIMEFYNELKNEFDKGSLKIWDSTLNLGLISGGTATNVVPDKAIIQVDFRYAEVAQAERYYEVESILMKKYDVKKQLIVDAINVSIEKENPIVKSYFESTQRFINKKDIDFTISNGSHDIREFFKVGVTPILFMPRGGDNHMESEWIKAKDLDVLVKVNVDFIKNSFSEVGKK